MEVGIGDGRNYIIAMPQNVMPLIGLMYRSPKPLKLHQSSSEQVFRAYPYTLLKLVQPYDNGGRASCAKLMLKSIKSKIDTSLKKHDRNNKSYNKYGTEKVHGNPCKNLTMGVTAPTFSENLLKFCIS